MTPRKITPCWASKPISEVTLIPPTLCSEHPSECRLQASGPGPLLHPHHGTQSLGATLTWLPPPQNTLRAGPARTPHSLGRPHPTLTWVLVSPLVRTAPAWEEGHQCGERERDSLGETGSPGALGSPSLKAAVLFSWVYSQPPETRGSCFCSRPAKAPGRVRGEELRAWGREEG